MFPGVNEVAVLVSTLLAIAVGTIWYSPMLFGDVWMKAAGLSDTNSDATKKQMPKIFILGFLTTLGTILVLAHAVSWADAIGMSLIELSFWLLALAGLVAAGSAVWEQKPHTYILINLGYTAIVVIGGMQVLAYWPW